MAHIDRSPSALRQSNIIDPSLAQAVRSRPLPPPPADFFAQREARAAHLCTLRHLMPVPGPIPLQVTEAEMFVPARDGHQIRVVHYFPTKSPPSSSSEPSAPLIILFHEGGWMMGDLSDEEFNARLLVRELGVVCLNVEYRLAPEHPFPAGVNDAWDVVQWAAANATSLGASPRNGFIVGGSSAGGNLAAVMAHLSRNGKLDPPVTGQWLSVPYLMSAHQLPEKYKNEFRSITENEDDPVLGGNMAQRETSILARTKIDPESSLFTVLAKDIYPPTDENQKGKTPLARAFIQVAGMDPLRDHGLLYDRILREEYGVETRVELYSGFGHMFWANWPELDKSKQFAKDMIEGFRWLLS